MCSLLAILLLLSLSAACGKADKAPTPITAAAFETAMEQKGYALEDYSSFYSEREDSTKTCLFANAEGIELVFLEMGTVLGTDFFYQDFKLSLQELKQADDAETIDETELQCTYKLRTAGGYYVLRKVGETVLYGFADTLYIQDLDALFGALGY